MTNVSRHQLSLSDIARLADVQRPVVSMWRRRPLAGQHFPDPIGRAGGEERFDAAEVAAYLAATARGNNPEAGDDLLAHARLAHVTDLDEAVAVEGVTALLCLAALTGDSLGGLSPAGLHQLTVQADPDDSFLAREIVALGADLGVLAVHADDLASASYSAPAAFEALLRRHSPSVFPGRAATVLVPEARTLVAKVAAALAADAGVDSPLFVDVTDGGGDLLLAVADLYAGELAPSLASLASDSPIARMARRRLRVHDLHRLDVRESSGDFSVDRGGSDLAVHVMRLPSAGAPGLSDLDVLDAIGNLVVQLDDDSRGVVIAPASALTDRPRTAELDMARDSILRSQRLRAVIRLPPGLVVHSPRQPLALWALGPAHPSVSVRDRWTAVGDVSDRHLDESVVEGIVTDVVAAMTPDEASAKGERAPVVAANDAEQVFGHQFRFACRVATTNLTLGRKSLVNWPVAPVIALHTTSAVELETTVEDLVSQLGTSFLADLKVSAAGFAATDRPGTATTVTLGQAVANGWLRILPGNRLNPEDIVHGRSGRAVIGVPEVLRESRVGVRRIDLMTFASRYEAGRLTEPNDVVLCTGSRSGAMVERDGTSVVQSPARVVRLTEVGARHLLPALVADDLTAALPSAPNWRQAPIRVLPDGVTDALLDTLDAIELERSTVEARLAALDQLRSTVTDGLASGSLTITRAPSIRLQNSTPTDEGH